MAVSRGACSRLFGYMMPPNSRGPFRTKEKYFIILTLGTFSFICFAAIWFLPDKSQGGKQRGVLQLRDEAGDVGIDFFMPPPPPMDPNSGKNPNIRHNVIERPDNDPHRNMEVEHLNAQIELDNEIERIRKNQGNGVLPKPNMEDPLKSKDDKKSSSNSPIDKDFAKPRQGNDVDLSPNVKPSGKKGPPKNAASEVQENTEPLITGGEDSDSTAIERRNFIKEMMRHAWDSYVKYAWGKNELRPVSKRGHTASIFGSSSMGATIVDAMDTLYIMGFNDEFDKGREWISNNLDMGQMTGDISVFETNIRYVGGLLALYSFTGDELFKSKAVHIVDKLLPAFDTPTGVPFALVTMRSGMAKNFGWASGGSSILSEFGTLHMEFSYLSDITGNPIYKQKVEKLRKFVKNAERPKKLYPNYLHPKTGKWGQQHTSVGALGDSFYEYLIKEWLRSGKRDMEAKEMFDSAATDIEEQLVQVSPGGLTYLAEYKYGRLEHKMDELACFAGGMYALASHTENDKNSDRWMDIGKGITNTCHEAFDRSDTKLGPEAFRFSDAVEARALKQNERYYILRPETVESYFYLWRLTKDEKYREWGWEAAQALEKTCRTDGGYSGVKNVYQVGGTKDDVQQSFFLAETLKYLYLLFSDDDLISLDEWVFNTEAHPLPIRGHNVMYRPHSKSNSNATS